MHTQDISTKGIHLKDATHVDICKAAKNMTADSRKNIILKILEDYPSSEMEKLWSQIKEICEQKMDMSQVRDSKIRAFINGLDLGEFQILCDRKNLVKEIHSLLTSKLSEKADEQYTVALPFSVMPVHEQLRKLGMNRNSTKELISHDDVEVTATLELNYMDTKPRLVKDVTLEQVHVHEETQAITLGDTKEEILHKEFSDRILQVEDAIAWAILTGVQCEFIAIHGDAKFGERQSLVKIHWPGQHIVGLANYDGFRGGECVFLGPKK